MVLDRHSYRPSRWMLLGMLILSIGWSLGSVSSALAQETNSPAPAVQHEVVHVGEDARVMEGETVSKVCTFWGNATVEGEVRDVVVVMFGNLKVSGKIRGTVVVVFGDLDAAATAVLRRPAIVVGGSLRSAPGARLRTDNVIISLDRMTERFPMLGGVVHWIQLGAFQLRPLPPQVLWVWVVPIAFFFLYALMTLILPAASESCVVAMVDRPIASYVLGLFGMCALMLLTPLLLLLGVVGFGIGFLVLVALMLASLFGRMAVVRFVGLQLGRQLGISPLEKPLPSLLLGALLFSLLYMVPVIGGLVWVGILPLAFGSLMMATYQAFRPVRSAAAVGPIPPLDAASAAAQPPPLESRPAAIVSASPAGFLIRCAATLLDFLLIGTIASIFSIQGRAFLFAWMCYHVAMWSWTGSTLGARAVGIRLVETDGRPVAFGVALVRCLAAFLSALPFFLGFVWCGWDRQKQSWHDKLTGTRMIWYRR